MGKIDNIRKWAEINRRKLIFFIIFFLIFGTSSLWISVIFGGFKIEDFIIGLLTISIAGVYSSAERILAFMRTKNVKGNEDLIELIAIAATFFVPIFVIGSINKCIGFSAAISIISYVLYCRLWWYQNRDNENLADNYNTLAGSAEQFKVQKGQ